MRASRLRCRGARPRSAAALLPIVAAIVLAACSHGGGQDVLFSERGVTLEVPPSWSVSGFSTTVFPQRLVAASYEVDRGDVEGDCGGHAAVERLPPDGALVLLIDYGESEDRFPDRLPVTLADGQLANFECFGRSYAFHLIVAGRALQAHVALGPDAGDDTRATALRVLNSVRVVRPPGPRAPGGPAGGAPAAAA